MSMVIWKYCNPYNTALTPIKEFFFNEKKSNSKVYFSNYSSTN